MSFTLVVAEARRGVFEERNLDTIGLANLLNRDTVLLVPDGDYDIDQGLCDAIIRVKIAEADFNNPVTMVRILQKILDAKGKPETILFTGSSSGIELASYAAGWFGMPFISDVSGIKGDSPIFLKSYYSDKVFGEFKPSGAPYVLTVRSGSFKSVASDKGKAAATEIINSITCGEGRSFLEYVEEEAASVDITKADFLLSVGRGIGNKDEITGYEELADMLRAVLSGSRPVIDKLWLPKARQVGTSGKTVKPKVYLAMAISGAFQHIAGMKDSNCIIAINKDPEAPIFQYAHVGVVADANKFRDKMKVLLKG
jgi:electron transfer flavoprotein alpha subunit